MVVPDVLQHCRWTALIARDPRRRNMMISIARIQALVHTAWRDEEKRNSNRKVIRATRELWTPPPGAVAFGGGPGVYLGFLWHCVILEVEPRE